MKKIAWEKWYDFAEPEEDENYLDFEDEQEDDEEENQERFLEIEPMILRTPLGNYAIYEPLNPSRMFNCWIMHTNFDITKSCISKIEKIPGIEVIKVMTRYRIFFGFGKLFDFSEIRKNIINSLDIEYTNEQLPSDLDKINILFTQMGECNKWAIFLGNDGTLVSIKSTDYSDEEYNQKLTEIQSLKDGNIFIYSEK